MRRSGGFIVLISALALALPARVEAQMTALYVKSSPGEPIGAGREMTWTPATLTFTTQRSSDGRSLSVEVTDFRFPVPPSYEYWHLTFEAPPGRTLVPGLYEFAAGAGPSTVGSTMPGLMVVANHLGCDTRGRFRVYEFEFDGLGRVTRFAADFEQHCDDASPVLLGAIRVNSTRSSLVPFDGEAPEYSIEIEPSPYGLVSGADITCGAGATGCHQIFAPDTLLTLRPTPSPGYVFLGWASHDCFGDETIAVRITRRKFCVPVFDAAPGTSGPAPDYSDAALFLDGLRAPNQPAWMPPGAPAAHAFVGPFIQIVVAEATASRLRFRVEGPRGAYWNLMFGAPAGAELASGDYWFAENDPSQPTTAPTLAFSHSSVCGSGGRFRIHELAFASGVLTAFAADFEAPCPDQMVTGSFRYLSSRSTLLPFGGDYPRYPLSMHSTIGGYIAADGLSCGDGGRTDCEEAYDSAGPRTLAAVPSTGYEFVGWTGMCMGGGPSMSVSIDGPTRCGAVFQPASGSSMPADPAIAARSAFLTWSGSQAQSFVWVPPDSAVSATQSGGQDIYVSASSFHVFHPSLSLRIRVPDGVMPGEYDEVYGRVTDLAPSIVISGCTVLTGRMVVHEVQMGVGSAIDTLSVDFEALCASPAGPHVAGSVRLNSTRAHLRPFDGNYPVFRLQVDRPVNGRVFGVGIACGSGSYADCTESYPAPSVVSLRAEPASGYRFVGWSGECSGGATTTINVNWVRRCTAVFDSNVPGVGFADARLAAAAFFLHSEPGDPVGAGHRKVWRPVEIGATGTSVLSVGIWATDGAIASILLRAPGSVPLTPGTYEDARYVFSGTGAEPGISVSYFHGNYGCTFVSGRFVIHEISYGGGGIVTSLAADFEQRCEPGFAPLRGSIRLNSSRASMTPFLANADWPRSSSADFNGDGWPDLVWRHAGTGRNAFWFMRGRDAIATLPMLPAGADTVADPDWEIRAAGDINGDENPDVIWQHATNGKIAVWFFSGETRIGTANFMTLGGTNSEPDLDWKIVAAADMNRDGHADLFWRNRATGAMRIWHLNGIEQWDSRPVSPTVAAGAWEVAGLADMDGDGWSDIVWRNYSTGAIATWLLADTAVRVTLPLTIGAVDPDWRIVGLADLDRDGSVDLVWQHSANGRLAVWHMTGFTVKATLLLNPGVVSDTSWRIVGVH